jgi:hypothetical protein
VEHIPSIFRVEEEAKQETILKQVACFFGKFSDFQGTARRYIPEDRTLHN